jgi:TetR/AcrR family transcriptional regulator, transcriptional repressor for nem operon
MGAQFKSLGKGSDSRGLAVHLLSAMQGVSVLAHTFHDPSMIEREAERLKQWIRAL